MTTLRWILVGVLATLTMDVGSTLIRKTGFTAGLTPNLVGRWFGSLAHGELGHHTIAETPPVAGEVPLALVTHCLIGISLALSLWGLLGVFSLAPSPFVAIVFGTSTSFLAWLWMLPSMGFGLFGLTGPPEMLLFRTSLVNHVVF